MMDIKIVLFDEPFFQCNGETCFEASKVIRKAIAGEKEIWGIVFIDNNPICFYFSPLGMDGNIFTNNSKHRLFIKHLIPIYVYMGLNP